MVIKFKDGYTVKVTDTEGMTARQIIDAAKQARQVCITAKDAELGKVISTNVSFQPMKLKAAIQSGDKEAVEREVQYLKRDIQADTTHKNYPSMYRKDVLKNIVDKYDEALSLLEGAKYSGVADLKADVLGIRAMWDIQTFEVQINAPGADTVKVTADTLREALDTANNARFKNQEASVIVIDNSTGEIIADFAPMAEDNTAIKDAYGDYEDEPLGKFSVEYDVFDKRTDDVVKYEQMFYGEAMTDEEAMDKFNKFIEKKLSPRYNAVRAKIRWYDSKKVNDIPYYDPTDAPRIKSAYSPDRITKEIAHYNEEGANLGELSKVFDEIDEFIEKGREALQEAGWTREDARHAIRERYYALVNALRDVDKDNIADALEARIHKLEKAWDLTR